MLCSKTNYAASTEYHAKSMPVFPMGLHIKRENVPVTYIAQHCMSGLVIIIYMADQNKKKTIKIITLVTFHSISTSSLFPPQNFMSLRLDRAVSNYFHGGLPTHSRVTTNYLGKVDGQISI